MRVTREGEASVRLGDERVLFERPFQGDPLDSKSVKLYEMARHVWRVYSMRLRGKCGVFGLKPKPSPNRPRLGHGGVSWRIFP